MNGDCSIFFNILITSLEIFKFLLFFKYKFICFSMSLLAFLHIIVVSLKIITLSAYNNIPTFVQQSNISVPGTLNGYDPCRFFQIRNQTLYRMGQSNVISSWDLSSLTYTQQNLFQTLDWSINVANLDIGFQTDQIAVTLLSPVNTSSFDILDPFTLQFLSSSYNDIMATYTLAKIIPTKNQYLHLLYSNSTNNILVVYDSNMVLLQTITFPISGLINATICEDESAIAIWDLQGMVLFVQYIGPNWLYYSYSSAVIPSGTIDWAMNSITLSKNGSIALLQYDSLTPFYVVNFKTIYQYAQISFSNTIINQAIFLDEDCHLIALTINYTTVQIYDSLTLTLQSTTYFNSVSNYSVVDYSSGTMYFCLQQKIQTFKIKCPRLAYRSTTTNQCLNCSVAINCYECDQDTGLCIACDINFTLNSSLECEPMIFSANTTNITNTTNMSTDFVNDTNSTGSTNVTNSTGSTNGTNSTDSTNSTNLTSSTNGINSTDSINSTNSTVSTNGTNSTDSINSTNSTGSTNGTNITNSTNSTGSTNGTNTSTNSTGSTNGTNTTNSTNSTVSTNTTNSTGSINSTSSTDVTNATSSSNGTNATTSINGTNTTSSTNSTNSTNNNGTNSTIIPPNSNGQSNAISPLQSLIINATLDSFKVINPIITTIFSIIQMSPFTLMFLSFMNYWNLCCLYSILDITVPAYLPQIHQKIFQAIQSSIFIELGFNPILPSLNNQSVTSTQYMVDYSIVLDFINPNFQNFLMILLVLLLILTTICLRNFLLQKSSFLYKLLKINIVQSLLGQFISFVPFVILPYRFLINETGFTIFSQKVNLILQVLLLILCFLTPCIFIWSRNQTYIENKLKKRKSLKEITRDSMKSKILMQKLKLKDQKTQNQNLKQLQLFVVNISVPLLIILPTYLPFFIINLGIFLYGIKKASKCKEYRINNIISACYLPVYHTCYLIFYLFGQNEFVYNYVGLFCLIILFLGGFHELCNVILLTLYEFFKWLIVTSKQKCFSSKISNQPLKSQMNNLKQASLNLQSSIINFENRNKVVNSYNQKQKVRPKNLIRFKWMGNQQKDQIFQDEAMKNRIKNIKFKIQRTYKRGLDVSQTMKPLVKKSFKKQQDNVTQTSDNIQHQRNIQKSQRTSNKNDQIFFKNLQQFDKTETKPNQKLNKFNQMLQKDLIIRKIRTGKNLPKYTVF